MRVSRTWAVPLMVGRPVAGLLAWAATASVASLVSDSWFSASSVKDTFTLMVLPWSASASVWLESVAPSMSVPSASHWYSKVTSSSPSLVGYAGRVRRQRPPPTWAVPEMVGKPVAGLLAWAAASFTSILKLAVSS